MSPKEISHQDPKGWQDKDLDFTFQLFTLKILEFSYSRKNTVCHGYFLTHVIVRDFPFKICLCTHKLLLLPQFGRCCYGKLIKIDSFLNIDWVIFLESSLTKSMMLGIIEVAETASLAVISIPPCLMRELHLNKMYGQKSNSQ